MGTDSSLLLLLNWMSPTFPIGSFAYSHGLEQAIALNKSTCTIAPMRALFLILPFLLLACAPREAAAQNFQLPIDCALGSDCVVQNYADANPQAGIAQDPMCGPLSYDGHDGLDLRAPAAC